MLSARSRRGPDVFFPLFFREYSKSKSTQNKLYYFIKTDNRSSVLDELVALGIDTSCIVFLDVHHSRFKAILDNFQLIKKLIRYKIGLVQLLTYVGEMEQLPMLKMIRVLPSFLRPKLTFTVTYNGIPTAFESDYDKRFIKDRTKYGALFGRIKFDGLLTWYDSFKEFVEKHPMFSYAPIVYSIKSRFCDYSRFKPVAKEKIIVWASALVNYKGPMMFLEAIRLVNEENPELLRTWKVIVAGNGPMQNEIAEYIKVHQLFMCEMIGELNDISPILNRSTCYVSTQEIDNFPSLAMNEAMASGNVIIARNVGRTYLFVEEEKNGWMMRTDDSAGLAESIRMFLSVPENHSTMMNRSVEMTKTIHTADNFITQMDEFWQLVFHKK